METLLKLIDFKNFELKINKELAFFNEIKHYLSNNTISFNAFPEHGNARAPISFAMAFSRQLDFQTVYILASIFKNYGLQFIYPRRYLKPLQIGLGTYVFENSPITFKGIKFVRKNFVAFSEPIGINKFLDIDPRRMMDEILENEFVKLPVLKFKKSKVPPLNYYNEDDGYYQDDRNTYSQYNGSYGLSDDTINDAFEGDPENYWNID